MATWRPGWRRWRSSWRVTWRAPGRSSGIPCSPPPSSPATWCCWTCCTARRCSTKSPCVLQNPPPLNCPTGFDPKTFVPLVRICILAAAQSLGQLQRQEVDFFCPWARERRTAYGSIIVSSRSHKKEDQGESQVAPRLQAVGYIRTRKVPNARDDTAPREAGADKQEIGGLAKQTLQLI